jgi:hypothetical protein
MESVELNIPAVVAEAHVSDVELKGMSSLQTQEESLLSTRPTVFQIELQSTWQLYCVSFQINPGRH